MDESEKLFESKIEFLISEEGGWEKLMTLDTATMTIAAWRWILLH